MAELIHKSISSSKLLDYTEISLGGSTSAQYTTRKQFQPTYTNVFDGQKNRNWREQVRNNLLASTPFTGSYTKWKFRPGFVDAYGVSLNANVKSPTGVMLTSGAIGLNIPILPDWAVPTVALYDSTTYNRALLRYYAKLRKEITACQGSVFIAELGKTLQMIKHPAQLLRKELSHVLTKAGRLRKIRKRKIRVAEMSNLWLQHQYGVRPLLADIEQGNRALEDTLGKTFLDPLYVKRVSAFENLKIHYGPSDVDHLNSNGGIGAFTYTNQLNYGCEVKFTGAVVIRKEPHMRVLQRFGISYADVVPTAWELIPWSFLIDYFTDIGQVLSAWSFPRSQVGWSQQTIRYFYEVEQTKFRPSSPSTIYRVFDPGILSARRTLLVRTPHYDELPLPRVNLHVPGSGSLRWLNIAALYEARKTGYYPSFKR